MKYRILLSCTLIWMNAHAAPIECIEQGSNSILVKLSVPHPKEAIIYRPSGVTVWLQTNGELLHQQIPEFDTLSEWEINSETEGTVYRNGKPKIERALVDSGTYHLYIAENTETERDNTYYVECYFEIEN